MTRNLRRPRYIWYEIYNIWNTHTISYVHILYHSSFKGIRSTTGTSPCFMGLIMPRHNIKRVRPVRSFRLVRPNLFYGYISTLVVRNYTNNRCVRTDGWLVDMFIQRLEPVWNQQIVPWNPFDTRINFLAKSVAKFEKKSSFVHPSHPNVLQ